MERTDAALAACPFAANMRTARALCDLAAFLCRRAKRDGDLERDVANELRVYAARHDGFVPRKEAADWALCDDTSVILDGAHGSRLRWERSDDRPTGFNPAVRTYAHPELPTLPFAYSTIAGLTLLSPPLLRDLLHTYLLDLPTPAGTPIRSLTATWGGDFMPALTFSTFHARAFAHLTAGGVAVSRTSALWEHVSAHGRVGGSSGGGGGAGGAAGGSSAFRRIQFVAAEDAEEPAPPVAVADAAIVVDDSASPVPDLTQPACDAPPVVQAVTVTPPAPPSPAAPAAPAGTGGALVRGAPVSGVKRRAGGGSRLPASRPSA